MFKKVINYFVDVFILRNKVGFIKRKYYAEFGKYSYIQKPIGDHDYANIHIGENVNILKNSRMQIYSTAINSNPQIFIGDDAYLVNNISIIAGDDVYIGENVLIASDVLIASEGHGMNPESNLNYNLQPLIAKRVRINNGVWIGEKSIILPGVEIGEKCIIGAGSVVTKSIPSFTIAAGNPAKPIKKYNFSTHKWEKIGEKS